MIEILLVLTGAQFAVVGLLAYHNFSLSQKEHLKQQAITKELESTLAALAQTHNEITKAQAHIDQKMDQLRLRIDSVASAKRPGLSL